jgi:hypothetical protein
VSFCALSQRGMVLDPQASATAGVTTHDYIGSQLSRPAAIARTLIQSVPPLPLRADHHQPPEPHPGSVNDLAPRVWPPSAALARLNLARAHGDLQRQKAPHGRLGIKGNSLI